MKYSLTYTATTPTLKLDIRIIDGICTWCKRAVSLNDAWRHECGTAETEAGQ